MAGSRAALLVFLALGLDGVHVLASAQRCDASADVVVEDESVASLYHEEIPEADRTSVTLFLQSFSGFEAVSVEAFSKKKTVAVWFPIDQCCSGTQNGSTWVPVKVEVEVKSYTYAFYLYFMLDFGGCVKKCEKRWGYYLKVFESLKVVAHGSSRWKSDKCGSPPNACLASCTTTTTTTTTTCQEPPRQFFVNSSSHSSPCTVTPTPPVVAIVSPPLKNSEDSDFDCFASTTPALVAVDITVLVAALVALLA